MDEQEWPEHRSPLCSEVPGCDGQCCHKTADLAREAVVQARRDEMRQAPAHVACVFHGRPYAEHDFFYGPECRRCGTRQAD